MRRNYRSSQRGQALVLFALVLPMLLMLMAFVLDVGWGYYMSKKAQTAADAAAMAAIDDVLQKVGAGGAVQCGTSVQCQQVGACPTSGNLYDGCQYAAANGFTQGGDSGGQSLSIAADTTSPIPNVAGISAAYWTQVTAQDKLPKWFSGMISPNSLSPAARSTATSDMSIP